MHVLGFKWPLPWRPSHEGVLPPLLVVKLHLPVVGVMGARLHGIAGGHEYTSQSIDLILRYTTDRVQLHLIRQEVHLYLPISKAHKITNSLGVTFSTTAGFSSVLTNCVCGLASVVMRALWQSASEPREEKLLKTLTRAMFVFEWAWLFV